MICDCCGQPDGVCPTCGRAHSPALGGARCESCTPRCPNCGEPATFDRDGFRVPCVGCGWGTEADRDAWMDDVR